MKENKANILVPVKGAKVDDEVVKLACTMVKNIKSKVYVIEVERSLPLYAEVEAEVKKGEELLNIKKALCIEQGDQLAVTIA